MMTLDQLLHDAPVFHGATSLGLSEPILREIDRRLRLLGDTTATLETGAGMSTVLFALRGCEHRCITPSREETQRITNYCHRRAIPLDRVQFVHEVSQRALPALEPRPLDFALIDGSHAFPTVFLDWFHIAARLKRGGQLLIDDLQLWTGHVLAEFLQRQPEWRFECELESRAAIFTKLEEGAELREWTEQPFVVEKSAPLIWRYRARRATELLQQGKLGELGRAIVRGVRPLSR